MQILKPNQGQIYSISAQGLQALLSSPRDPQYPEKNIRWTDNFTVELPIRKTTEGVGALEPTTLIHEFKRANEVYRNKPALSVKRNQKWQTITFSEYFEECKRFASSLIAYNLPPFSSINIIGFNSPQWAISFFGGLFAGAISTGVYSTNSEEVCQFIAENSECKILVAENMSYAKRYLKLVQQGKIKLIILYNDADTNLEQFQGKIVHWDSFMSKSTNDQYEEVEQRMSKPQPGSCATLIYTSGTTGMPKGVMLSHDNLTWTKKSMDCFQEREESDIKMVSYLPLSHVAGLYADLVTPMMSGFHIYFAQPDALQGSLIETLKQVRPNAFFSVPRVWQKIDDKMKTIAKQNGWLKTKIATWAKNLGAEGTMQELRKQKTSWQFRLAKNLIFNQIKKQLGLDQCNYFMYGSAPLDPQIRQYFLSLNIFLINSYGMSESTGPQNFSNKNAFDYKDLAYLKEVGTNLPGTEIKILKQNQNDEDGQICYRGRNIFMGYYKNPQQSHKVFDQNGYLHSGDLGKLNSDNVLFITGRVKQLIITAGGQNIPPILIQDKLKAALPFASNVMVVGEGRKFLTCLITLKEETAGSGKVEKNSRQFLKNKGVDVSTVDQVRKHGNMRKIVLEGLQKANSQAISRAQKVQNFCILHEDFSVENGTLTPTLKIKRKQTVLKYEKQIQQMYMNAKL